jgi:predicted ArsR family transcriptional regulator
MANGKPTADADLLHLLADAGPSAISEIEQHLEITRTAVHERLLRLMVEGLVDRELVRGGRGRPSYQYSLSPKARKLSGNNFADLAAVLWQQVLGIDDSRRRQHVITSIASALKVLYADAIRGTTLKARMESLRELLEKRRVRCEIDTPVDGPTFTLRDCPYSELAEVDSTICEMETMLFSQLLGDEVVLSQCRLDGHSCCQFEPKSETNNQEGQNNCLTRSSAAIT